MTLKRQIAAHETGRSLRGEEGFLLVFVVLMAALVLIALAVAAPVVAKNLQRDKELESAHRANEYVRAIRLYYRKNKTYPPSIDALENTNNVRYLRKQYIDPLTGKNNWRLIHVGENKTTVKGFFGEPLGGLNTTGAGGSSLGTPIGGAASTAGSTSTVGASSPLGAGFTGAQIGTGGSTASGGAAGSGSTTPGSNTTAGSDGSQSLGQVMGVGTAKTGDSILNPNQQTSYETWEFLYDPKIELLYQKANLFGGPSTIGSQSPSSLGSNNSTGSTNTQSGSGSSSPTAPVSSPP